MGGRVTAKQHKARQNVCITKTDRKQGHVELMYYDSIEISSKSRDGCITKTEKAESEGVLQRGKPKGTVESRVRVDLRALVHSLLPIWVCITTPMRRPSIEGK